MKSVLVDQIQFSQLSHLLVVAKEEEVTDQDVLVVMVVLVVALVAVLEVQQAEQEILHP